MGRIGNYESRVKPYLEQIKMWLHGGATEADCYKKLGVCADSWFEYKRKYLEFAEALKEDKDFADTQVENALYNSAISGNVTAMIFWLKNRKPKAWREKVEELTDNTVKVVIDRKVQDLTVKDDE